MGDRLQRLKLAVTPRTLLLLAALAWIGAGALLSVRGAGWLTGVSHVAWRVTAGLLAALLIHRFGFSRVVRKNLTRISAMEGGRCAFSFFSWKSYLTIAVMMALGAGLRHAPIPRAHLAVLYIGIGVALILSSTRYLRAALAT